MRTVSEMLTDRTQEIRHNPFYRMRLALRDKTDYWHDETEQKPEPPREVIHRHSDMSKKEFAKLRDLDRAVQYLLNKDKEKAKREEYY